MYYRLTPNAKGLIEAHGDISKDCGLEHNDLLQGRLSHLHRMAVNDMWFMPEVYLFLRTAAHAKKHFTPLPASELEKKCEQFEREAHSLESALVHAGLQPQRLSSSKWFHLLFEHFNPARSEIMPPPKLREDGGPFGESLASQMIATDISYDKDAIKLGPYYFRCISLKSLPQETTHAGLSDLFKLPFHYWLSQSIDLPKQQREVENYKFQDVLPVPCPMGPIM